jgi:hypothetical protein
VEVRRGRGVSSTRPWSNACLTHWQSRPIETEIEIAEFARHGDGTFIGHVVQIIGAEAAQHIQQTLTRTATAIGKRLWPIKPEPFGME